LTLLKRGLTAPKIAEIGNIWYKFAKMGYTTLSDLKKNEIWLRDGVPGQHPHRQLLADFFVMSIVHSCILAPTA